MSYAPLPVNVSTASRMDGHAADSMDPLKKPRPEQHLNSMPSFESIFTSNNSIQGKCMACASLLKYHIVSRYNELRPWSEFLDMSSFVSPNGGGEIISRLSVNCRYFYPNYMLLALLFSSYVLLVNLSFSICFLIGWLMYTYIRIEAANLSAAGNYFGDISFCGNPVPTAYLYTFLVIYGIISFYFTGGSSVVFWLALATSIAVFPHAIYRRPSIADPTYQLA